MADLNDLTDVNEPPIWRVTYGDYSYELFPTNRALVYKAGQDKASYEITESGCDCPSRMYRGLPCKHEKPIAWIGSKDKDTEDTLGLDTDDIGFFDAATILDDYAATDSDETWTDRRQALTELTEFDDIGSLLDD